MPLRGQSAFVVQEHPYGKVVRVTARGLDFATIGEVGPQLVRLAVASGAGRLHVDLAQVEYLTGAALGTLVAMHRKIAKAGGTFLIRNVNDFSCEQLQVTRLDTVLSVRPRAAGIVLASA